MEQSSWRCRTRRAGLWLAFAASQTLPSPGVWANAIEPADCVAARSMCDVAPSQAVIFGVSLDASTGERQMVVHAVHAPEGATLTVAVGTLAQVASHRDWPEDRRVAAVLVAGAKQAQPVAHGGPGATMAAATWLPLCHPCTGHVGVSATELSDALLSDAATCRQKLDAADPLYCPEPGCSAAGQAAGAGAMGTLLLLGVVLTVAWRRRRVSSASIS